MTFELIWKRILLLNCEEDMCIVTLVILQFFIFFLFALYWASYKDRQSLKVNRVYVPTQTFSPFYNQQYLICLVTGHQRPSNTSSEVSILLFGHEKYSKRIDITSAEYFFKAGSETWVLVTSPYCLDQIKGLVLFVNGKDFQPNWYCSDVYIRNLHSGDDLYCQINSWLPPDGELKYLIKDVTNQYETSAVVKKTFVELLRGYHVFISVIYGLDRLHHTRVKHVLCLFLSTSTFMTIAILVYGQPTLFLTPDIFGRSKKAHFQPKHIYLAVGTAFIALFVCMLLSWVVIRSFPFRGKEIDWQPPHIYTENKGVSVKREIHTQRFSSNKLRVIFKSISPQGTRLHSVSSQGTNVQSVSSWGTRLHSVSSLVTKSGSNTPNRSSLKDSMRVAESKNNRNASNYSGTSSDVTWPTGNALTASHSMRVDPQTLIDESYIPNTRGGWRKEDRQWAYYEPVAYCLVVGLLLVEVYVLFMGSLFYTQKSLHEFIFVCLTAYPLFVIILQPIMLLFIAFIKVFRKDIYWIKKANQIAEAWYREMGVVLQYCSEGKARVNSNVGQDRCPVLHRHERNSMRIIKFLSKRPMLSGPVGSGGVVALLNVVFTIVILVLVNVQVSSVFQKYLQTVHIQRMLGIGFEMIPLDKSLDVNEIWDDIKNRFYGQLKANTLSMTSTSGLFLLSNIRVRQLRHVRYTGDCAANNPRLIEPKCHEPYEDATPDTHHYIQSWKHPLLSQNTIPKAGPYTFSKSEWYEFGDYNLLTPEESYFVKGGYDFLLDVAIVEPTIFAYIDTATDWVDEWTKLIRVDLTMYNSDTGLASVVTVAYRFLPAGIFQVSDITTFHLTYKDEKEVFLLISLIVFSFMVFILVTKTLYQMRIQGTKEYFKAGSNKSFVVELLLCVLVIACFFLSNISRSAKLKEFREVRFNKETLKKFVEFRSLATFEFIITCICAILTLINLVKLFISSRFIPYSVMFRKSVSILMPNWIVPAFATVQLQVLGQLLFASHVYSFSSFRESHMFVLVLVLFGKNYWLQLSKYYQPGQGVVYFVFATFLMNYIYLNYFIAILNLVFSQYKEQKRTSSKGRSFVSYFKSKAKAFSTKQEIDQEETNPELDKLASFEKKARADFYVMSHGHIQTEEIVDPSRSLLSRKDTSKGYLLSRRGTYKDYLLSRRRTYKDELLSRLGTYKDDLLSRLGTHIDHVLSRQGTHKDKEGF